MCHRHLSHLRLSHFLLRQIATRHTNYFHPIELLHLLLILTLVHQMLDLPQTWTLKTSLPTSDCRRSWLLSVCLSLQLLWFLAVSYCFSYLRVSYQTSSVILEASCSKPGRRVQSTEFPFQQPHQLSHHLFIPSMVSAIP